jgi:hypothetical protein
MFQMSTSANIRYNMVHEKSKRGSFYSLCELMSYLMMAEMDS